MAFKIYGPRKRRTRQHVIADLGVHHVEGFVLAAGLTAERFFRDYGYDLAMTTFDHRGFIEPRAVYFQIKASEALRFSQGHYGYDIDIRDFNLWFHEKIPIVLVLYDAARGCAFWQDIQQYFSENDMRQPRRGAKWVRVLIPQSQVLNRDAIADLRGRKNKGEL